ncbi:MAG: hypothetical protein MJ156_02565 [Alphaproteobacteria bacterium]|nr:hypothetical protein [Alphaproteobacteria bacterium]
MSKGWDGSMLKKLKSLVGKGLSTSEMGKKLGMSKNAVVGKLNRLGWNTKATTSTDKKKKTTQTQKTAKKETSTKTTTKTTKKVTTKTVLPKAKETTKKSQKKVVSTKTKESTPKTASRKTNKDLALHQRLIQHALQMANLKPNQCRWPIGDPDTDNFHFCGEQVFAGKPYCYEHCRQAYQFTPPKKK